MRQVSIEGLRKNLAKYVRLSAAGETIAITYRNRVIAQLRPPEPDLRKMSS
jgi:antitoxin (DNA-binding transcriptional repressor) of toxin-antitoxin stability system